MTTETTLQTGVTVDPAAAPIHNHPICSPGPIHHVIQICARYYSLTFTEIVGNSRRKRQTEARHMAMYLAYRDTGKTMTQIAKVFSDRDHSTLSHAIQKIEHLLEYHGATIRDALELGALMVEAER